MRVAASTHTDLASALVAGMATLKGPLHGGAPSGVADMMSRIGSPAEAQAWIGTELAAGRRIMGLGHRGYHTTDPRAAALRAIATKLSGRSAVLDLYVEVEKAALAILARRHLERPLGTNVEFHMARVHRMVGVPPTASPAVFALARSAGWSAHVLEQVASGRLIRPLAHHTGPAPTAERGRRRSGRPPRPSGLVRRRHVKGHLQPFQLLMTATAKVGATSSRGENWPWASS